MAELVFVALGSNLGDRAAYLAEARRALGALDGTQLVAESEVEETAPLGPVGQGPFLNQMVALTTTLPPRDLLDHLHAIERQAGRVRTERWGPRTLDLDIVRFGDRTIDEPGLVVPHPELPNRDFWQRELGQLHHQLRAGVAP
jgi:2-amino-4-hydroxy-6-hydroxymethyldihydropteridine diphosphokinase